MKWNKEFKRGARIDGYEIASLNIDRVILKKMEMGFERELIVERIKKDFYVQKILLSSGGKSTQLMLEEKDLEVAQVVIEQMKYKIIDDMYLNGAYSIVDIAKKIGFAYNKTYTYIRTKGYKVVE